MSDITISFPPMAVSRCSKASVLRFKEGTLGANGAGKSTLMKFILGMVHIRSGSIAFQGTGTGGRDRAHGHLFVPEAEEFIELSVEKNLEIGTFFRKPYRDKELLDMRCSPACTV